MYKIGLRNIKTAIAVFLSLLVYFIIFTVAYISTDDIAKSVKISTKSYTPFFACLAAAYSVSTDKKMSFAQAKLRVIASVIGGLFGVFVVFLYTKVFKQDWGFTHINSLGNVSGFDTTSLNFKDIVFSFGIPVVLIALSTTITIWLCNIFHQRSACFVAVLTLTAVMSSFGTDPIVYGINRIFSTMIGILVALGVNLFRLPRKRNKDILFIVGLDGVAFDDNIIDGFEAYKLNNLTYLGADLTYFTTRTPSTLYSIMENVYIEKPFICMSGAALYDPNDKKYLYVENIPVDITVRLVRLFKELDLSPFVNIISDDVLYIYNENPTNIGEKVYINNRKNNSYACYINNSYPHTMDVCYFVLVDKKEKIKELQNEISKESYHDEIIMMEYDFYEDRENASGYSYLKIYSSKILDLMALKVLNKENKMIVSASCHEYDMHLVNNSNYTITNQSAPQSIKDASYKVCKGKENPPIFKELGKAYNRKNYLN